MIPKNRTLRWAALAGLGILLTFVLFRFMVMNWPVPFILRDAIIIPPGASALRVAKILKDRELIGNEHIFVNALRVQVKTRSIHAGLFQLTNVRRVGDLVEQLVNPQIKSVQVTIPEGSTREDIARFIHAKYSIDTTRFLALTTDEDFMSSLGIRAPSLEGYLFPETYRLQNGITEAEIITLMVTETKYALSEDVVTRGARLGLDAHEILTLASIIEGEARVDSERSLISAVYHNRLRKGMRLQADPTVQYAIPGAPRRLYFQDYDYVSEYNTYRIDGLPPGPVNSPGLASIRAAVNPADVDFLFFVADGSGRHIFSRTREEHEQTVRSVQGVE